MASVAREIKIMASSTRLSPYFSVRCKTLGVFSSLDTTKAFAIFVEHVHLAGSGRSIEPDLVKRLQLAV